MDYIESRPRLFELLKLLIFQEFQKLSFIMTRHHATHATFINDQSFFKKNKLAGKEYKTISYDRLVDPQM